ncbi:MAG: hypothetical protein P8I13_06900 [Porticoccaceae bacterium]|nr:hypothetical protein [Porticoccaceae bacterium]
MNNQNLLSPQTLVIIFILSICLQATKAQADGLEITLNEKEQALLNSLEQKNQADSLIKLLETLEKLSDYPTEAIDELTGKNPNHQVINRVVKRLKKAKEKSVNGLAPLNFDSHKDATDGDTPKNSPLIPVFASASSDNGITTGKVIFKNNAGTAISSHVGEAFIYMGEQYKLLSVSPITDTQGQFNISLKTPTSTQIYIWPR